jgi:DNA-binding transcriptional regulator LsrR (DeoR family)
LVYDVAVECIEKDKPYARAVEALNAKYPDLTPAKVLAICKAARDAGWVRVAVLAPSDAQDNRALEAELRDRFGLLGCIVTPGRAEMLAQPLDCNIREVIMEEITRAAAAELDRRLGEIEEPCLAVNFGVVARRIQGHLRPDRGIKNREGERQHGLVVAAQGVRTLRADRFDANNIVRDIARAYAYDHICLPIPAYVGESGDAVRQIPLVNEAFKALDGANIVIGSLGALHQQARKETRRPETWMQRGSVQRDISLPEHLKRIRDEGGFANIGGWWFNALGSPLAYTERSIAGMTLTRIKRLVASRKPVLLAVGADPTRVPALWVALKHGICNLLVVDEVTAGLLIGRHKFQSQVVAWEPTEVEVLRAAGMID